jgi:hypothetical protein
MAWIGLTHPHSNDGTGTLGGDGKKLAEGKIECTHLRG